MEPMIADPYVNILWYCYVAGVAGLMLATWWLFRRHSELAQFCTITVAAWLLTPVALAPPDYPQMAPAFFIFVLDGLFTDAPVARVAWPLALVWLGAIVASLLVRLLWRKFRARQRQPIAQASAVTDDQATS